jgi:hypothetical protein
VIKQFKEIKYLHDWYSWTNEVLNYDQLIHVRQQALHVTASWKIDSIPIYLQIIHHLKKFNKPNRNMIFV